MTRRGVSARRQRTGASDEPPTPASLTRRVAWLVLAGFCLFLVIALASFDSADWPSYVVAVHNDPPANLCGRIGALVSYNAYAVIGVGAWILVAGVVGLLIVTARGGRVGHPLVRTLGLMLAAVSISCFHGLLAPGTGPLAGAHAGLIASDVVSAFTARFNSVGTLLILFASLAIGAVVAADRLVLGAVRLVLRGVGLARYAPRPT